MKFLARYARAVQLNAGDGGVCRGFQGVCGMAQRNQRYPRNVIGTATFDYHHDAILPRYEVAMTDSMFREDGKTSLSSGASHVCHMLVSRPMRHQDRTTSMHVLQVDLPSSTTTVRLVSMFTANPPFMAYQISQVCGTARWSTMDCRCGVASGRLTRLIRGTCLVRDDGAKAKTETCITNSRGHRDASW
jgi:hypothetical protein